MATTKDHDGHEAAAAPPRPALILGESEFNPEAMVDTLSDVQCQAQRLVHAHANVCRALERLATATLRGEPVDRETLFAFCGDARREGAALAGEIATKIAHIWILVDEASAHRRREEEARRAGAEGAPPVTPGEMH